MVEKSNEELLDAYAHALRDFAASKPAKLEQARAAALARMAGPGEVVVPATGAAFDVLAERKRQTEAEGWTPEHDDEEHNAGQLADAAASYILGKDWIDKIKIWPWSWMWWKPKGRRRDLVRAAALVIAEIERLDRAARPNNGGNDDAAA